MKSGVRHWQQALHSVEVLPPRSPTATARGLGTGFAWIYVHVRRERIASLFHPDVNKVEGSPYDTMA